VGGTDVPPVAEVKYFSYDTITLDAWGVSIHDSKSVYTPISGRFSVLLRNQYRDGHDTQLQRCCVFSLHFDFHSLHSLYVSPIFADSFSLSYARPNNLTNLPARLFLDALNKRARGVT
jgi:hypothetical protein